MKRAVLLLCCLCLLCGCAPVSEPLVSANLKIVVAQKQTPPGCVLAAGTPRALAISGLIPVKSTVQWNSSLGQIKPKSGPLTMFYPPRSPVMVKVGASIINNGTPLPLPTTVCQVVDPQVLLRTLTLETVEPPPVSKTPATATDTPTPTASATPTATSTVTPSATPTITNTPTVSYTNRELVITEIMANPCGRSLDELVNEYVEIYNNSDVPIDIRGYPERKASAGWFLYASRQRDNLTPARLIVTWNERWPGDVRDNLVTDSFLIPPHGYAVILAPMYFRRNPAPPHPQPYTFPKGTILLTLESPADVIGKFSDGLSARSGAAKDSLILYFGTRDRMDEVKSTYAVKEYSLSPDSLVERISVAQHFPLAVNDCEAIRRTSVDALDDPNSWISIDEGTPGW